MATKILVVDDVPAIRRSVRFFLEQETDWVICGEAENGKLAIERVQELRPDVVLLDLSMPVMNGLDAARVIKAIAPDTHILMFTLHLHAQLVDEAGRPASRTYFLRQALPALNCSMPSAPCSLPSSLLPTS
jgi:DNA-binding NarL/FixJ family response regulator